MSSSASASKPASQSPASPEAPSPNGSIFASRRLSPQGRRALLDGVVARVAEEHERTPVLVFDLDGTLMDNRPRVVAILHELADLWRARRPDAAEACAQASIDRVVYGFQQNLQLLGVHDPALLDEGLSFWKARFFRDAHVRHDIAVAGAVAFVQDCYDAGAICVYLTGRDLPNMALGSFASLRDLGFPIGRLRTELVVKPRFETPDAEFKRNVAPEVLRLGRLHGVFDNEPANNNLFLEVHPDAASVFLDTQHAPDPPPLDERVQVIDTFER